MRQLRRFIGAALLTLAALLLTFKFKAALGWSPDFLVPVLAAAGFLLDLVPLALLAILAAWVLNWQAGFPPELWFVLAVPFAAWLGKRFLPSAPWLTLAAVVAAGELLFYGIADTVVFWPSFGFIFSNILFATLFALTLQRLFAYIYGTPD